MIAARLFLASLLCAAAFAGDVRLAYVGPTDSSAWKGAQLGIDESNVLGRFLGQTFTLDVVAEEQALSEWKSADPVAVVASVDSKTLSALAKKLEAGEVAVINVSSRADDLRSQCRPNLLHVIPSEKMLGDAAAQWRKKNPDAKVEGRAWHADFVKFAGRDLNKRYTEKFGDPMDDEAWSGWAAVRMAADAVVRAPGGDVGDVLRYLREELEFDGNKGPAHTFRETGQLRQPLMIVEGDKLLGEAPVRGVADSEDLDSLGLMECK